MHADNERYNALRVALRDKQQALEKALQVCCMPCVRLKLFNSDFHIRLYALIIVLKHYFCAGNKSVQG